jgi:fatty acid desaturase
LIIAFHIQSTSKYRVNARLDTSLGLSQAANIAVTARQATVAATFLKFNLIFTIFLKIYFVNILLISVSLSGCPLLLFGFQSVTLVFPPHCRPLAPNASFDATKVRTKKISTVPNLCDSTVPNLCDTTVPNLCDSKKY